MSFKIEEFWGTYLLLSLEKPSAPVIDLWIRFKREEMMEGSMDKVFLNRVASSVPSFRIGVATFENALEFIIYMFQTEQEKALEYLTNLQKSQFWSAAYPLSLMQKQMKALQLGADYLLHKDSEAAIMCLQQIIQLQEKAEGLAKERVLEVKICLGNCYYRFGQYQEALKTYQQSLHYNQQFLNNPYFELLVCIGLKRVHLALSNLEGSHKMEQMILFILRQHPEWAEMVREDLIERLLGFLNHF